MHGENGSEPPCGSRSRTTRLKHMADDEASLRKAFAVFDTDGNGSLSETELASILSRGQEKNERAVEAAKKEAQGIIKKFDDNGDGVLQIEEYMTWWKATYKPTRYNAFGLENVPVSASEYKALLEAGLKPAGLTPEKVQAQPLTELVKQLGSELPLDLKVRCVCKPALAKSADIEVEGPLQAVFSSHPNWQEPVLKEFCTVLVPMARLLQLAEEGIFSLSSYRWLNIDEGDCGDRRVAIPSNYAWYLDVIGDKSFGWLDFVSHRQARIIRSSRSSSACRHAPLSCSISPRSRLAPAEP